MTAKVDELVGIHKKSLFSFIISKCGKVFVPVWRGLEGEGYTMLCLGTIHSKEGWIQLLGGLVHRNLIYIEFSSGVSSHFGCKTNGIIISCKNQCSIGIDLIFP